MKSLALTFLGILLIAFVAPAAEKPEEKGYSIFKTANIRDSGFEDYSCHLIMTLRNRSNQESVRQIRVRVLEKPDDGDKNIAIFDNPRDVKGTVFLSHTHKTGDDDQWLFLPALKRVKRISAQNKSGSFMGSEFAYEDIVSQEIEKYTYKWIRDEVVEGIECFVVERFPVDKNNSGYTRLVTWIDKEHYRQIKVDYYDRKGFLLKTLNSSGYRQYLAKHGRPTEMQMVNHQNGKSTQLAWSDYQFRVGLNDRDFNSRTLRTIR